MAKSLKEYLEQAEREGWAMAQFNFSSAEQLQGIVQASVDEESPLLVGTSEGDSSFVGMDQAADLVRSYREETGIPIFLNLDHGKSVESVKEAIEARYDAIHIDASKLSFEENIELTKQVVDISREKGIEIIEGELGTIPGSSQVHEGEAPVDEKQFTDPAQAAEFVEKTGVTSLAIVFGNAHGVYEGTERLDLQRLQDIKKSVQSFIVLHGGSGIDESDVKEAISHGIVKVNVSTELRRAFTDTLRKVLGDNPKEVTPYKLLPEVVEAVRVATREHIQLYGSSKKI